MENNAHKKCDGQTDGQTDRHTRNNIPARTRIKYIFVHVFQLHHMHVTIAAVIKITNDMLKFIDYQVEMYHV